MVFNATSNNISVLSWWSVLLVEDIAKCKANVFLKVDSKESDIYV